MKVGTSEEVVEGEDEPNGVGTELSISDGELLGLDDLLTVGDDDGSELGIVEGCKDGV
jgi:hypothetical protein